MQQGTLSPNGVATASYTLVTGLDGATHWVLADAAGTIRLTSRVYYNADEALGGIELARWAATKPEAFESWRAPAGYGFTVHAPGWELAHSPLYADAESRDAAAAQVRAEAATRALLDLRAGDPE